jgi:diadenosine tetraphosphate (Ap4A) HIT family hydrolase
MTLPTCIFCTPDREILAESTHALAFADGFPVSPGHTLVVPRRHVVTIFDLPEDEYADCFLLALKVKALLAARHAPDGFNIGANCGEAGGQSVWHAHIHVIPRFAGDTPHPRGGVRNVIPRKAEY